MSLLLDHGDVGAAGEPLKERRKLKDFCSYSCRCQQAVDTLSGVPHQTAFVGSENTHKTKALQRLKRQSVAGFSFAKIS
jgi:hypothetical protein